MSAGKDDIIQRLRTAYAFLRDDGRFITANTCLTALTEVKQLRERLEDKTNSLRVEIAAKQAAYNDISAAEEETRSWRAVAERLEGEIQDLLHACDCEIRDMTHNRNDPDKRSAAYAEGALRVARGIAHRIREKAAAR